MKILSKVRRSLLIITLIISCVILLVKCADNTNSQKEQPLQPSDLFEKFAGSASCQNCHKDIYKTHIHTEHYLTSEPSIASNILGSFEEGKNRFAFNSFTSVDMEKSDSSFYQAEYVNGVEVKRARFDITIGSGRKGQSYLSWIGDRLTQLPITYFSSAKQWSNSPGYPPLKPVFVRPITSRCLECHTTYAEKISEDGIVWESFDKNRMVYRIDCEKCHGPAKMHVEFQSEHPDVKEAKYIVNTGKLSRQQNLDLCGLCHRGSLKKTQPSFRFQAGDTLSDFFFIPPISPDTTFGIDVHGNQLGLLSLSKCFRMSQLTCISCHNIHENESGKISLFSTRCMNCHQEGHNKVCKMTQKIGPAIAQNCVDCHMPKQLSHAVAVFLQGSGTPTPALMRTHFIKIYADETSKVLKELKKQVKNIK